MDSVDGRDKLLADLVARTANGAAPRFIAPHTERSRQRAQTTITRILQDPTVRAELARIRELVGPIEPPPGHDPPSVLRLLVRGRAHIPDARGACGF